MSSVGAAGSSTPTLPAVQTPEVKDNQKASTPQQDAAQNTEAAKASEQHATQQLGERNLESSLRAADLRASLSTGSGERKLNPNAPKLEYIEKGGAVARQGQTGESVTEIRKALNAAGANPPLDDSNKFDAKTETAVKEFQKKNGLMEDGRVGPDTLKQLIHTPENVVKDPKIAKLDPGVQKEIADRIGKSPKDYEAHQRLLDVSRADGFDKLGAAQQRQMLGILDKAPHDKALAGDLGKMAGSENFRKLDPSIQQLGLTQLGKNATDRTARETLVKLQTTNGFQNLSTHEQERLLTMVGGENKLVSKPAREELAKTMNGWSTNGNAETQGRDLKKFLNDQTWTDWETPAGAWNGRTAPPDSVRGPESIAKGPFRLQEGAADKYTVKYGAKEIPVYVPAGTSRADVDKLIGTMDALPKANRQLINQVVLERQNDAASPRRFDALDGTVRAYPEGMALEPPDRRMSGMVHESAHLIDKHLQTKLGPQWDTDWKKAMGDDKLVGSQYGKKNDAEDFAEAYLLYKVSKGTPQFDEYRAMFPNRWKLIDDIDAKANAGTL